MGRLWLVLAMLCVLAGTAAAKREPACECQTTRTLPREGAVDVPTNARLWRLPADTGAPDQPIQRYELQPHTAYELASLGLSFTTGAGRDDTPPVMPGIGMVSITLTPSHRVSVLHIAGTFDSDTAVVRVTLGSITYWTTPDALTTCEPGISFEPVAMEGEIVAVDLAGNESPPASFSVTPIVVEDSPPICYGDHHHYHCGTPLVALVYFGPFIGLIAFLVLILVIAFRSARSRAHSEPEPLALASAVYLAHAVRLRAHLTLGVVAVTCGGASIDDGVAVMAVMASPVLAWLAIRSLVRWAQASRFARLLRYDGVTAEVHGDHVTIVVGGKVAFLRASPSLVEKAKRNALPKASL